MSPEQIGAADIPTPVLDLDAADMKAESERYAAEVEIWARRKHRSTRRHAVLLGRDLPALLGQPEGTRVSVVSLTRPHGEYRLDVIMQGPPS